MAKKSTKKPDAAEAAPVMDMSSLDSMSISDLQGIIATRKKRRNQLEKRRDKLRADLDAVEAQIADIDGSGGRVTGGKRPRNDQALPDVIEKVMKRHGKHMRVPQIVEGVQSEGYLSTSSNFRGIVNQTLIKEDRFKSVERGVYGLK
jgi:hypothetical protein